MSCLFSCSSCTQSGTCKKVSSKILFRKNQNQSNMKEHLYLVIDGDRMLILEKFSDGQRDEIYKKYVGLGMWDDVDFDSSGDLVLYEY